MAPLNRALRSVIGAVKDQTSIGLAKVTSTRAPDLDVAVVKATSHEEGPVEERYVHEILQLVSLSGAYAGAAVSALARRLGKTHNWIVAIKALMLVHRLLRDGGPAFERELLLGYGRRVLNLSDFRDDSHSNAWDYSSFVRAYALFLDERLDCLGSARAGPAVLNESESESGYYGYQERSYKKGPAPPPIKDLKPVEVLERLPPLQKLLDRVIACRPTGAARSNRLVQIALYPVVSESFDAHIDVRDGLAVLLDAFFTMDRADCRKAFEIYSRGAKQVDELISFYKICKDVGICRSTEYPTVQKIPEELLETLEDFLLDKTESSLSPPPPKGRRSISRSPEREQEAEKSFEMKALPAPPSIDPPQLTTHTPSNPVKEDNDADLLNLNKPSMSAEEHGDSLALALFSGTESSNSNGIPASSNGIPSSSNRETNGGGGVVGWELALVTSASQLSKMNTSTQMGGGFDRLLLDGMYDRVIDGQKYHPKAFQGSASSVASIARPAASNYLALPCPTGQSGDDPFAASLSIPPPSYVQMSDMKEKQQLLLQEQQLWTQYQRDGMQGYGGIMKFYNNTQIAPYQPGYAPPYYGMPMGSHAAYY